MSRAAVERFYAAFERLDSAAMEACYADNARFDDEVFSLGGRRRIGGMWRMLCGATKAQGRAQWELQTSDITEQGSRVSAHWETRYLFPASGRLVHNQIDAEFEFDADDLIARHRDRFDFWRWARQALGMPGLLLGWTPYLRQQVRARAAATLHRFLERA